MAPSDLIGQDWSRRIAAERARLEDQRRALVEAFDGIVAATDLEPADDEHDPDGTTAYERAQVASLIAAADLRLAELAQAAHRVDAGSFGRCDGCGDAIAPERLVALPETTRCIRCAAGRVTPI
jgi:RNA polymerase-binding transcription factor DksA